MKVAISCDHRGIEFKKGIIEVVERLGHTIDDLGTYTEESVDYPDYAVKVARGVASGDYDRGIVLCSTGIGVSIAANKIKGIRAALCCNVFAAEMTRRHNDANVLALGADYGLDCVPEIVELFLSTEFEGGRHQRRVDKMKALDDER